MMTSIFSSFDLSLMNTQNKIFNPISSLIPLIMFNQMYWISPPSRLSINYMIYLTTHELTNPTKGWHMKGFMYIMTSVFSMIAMTNLWGSMPYILPMSAHLSYTFSLGLLMWLSTMSTSTFYNMKSSSSHFLPENTPMLMSPFLSLVETLSSYIRPVTLSFRLAANISAGHVILAMITTATPILMLLISSPFFPIMSMLMNTMYTMFELMICLVQAFVFTLLSSMYSSDYIPKNKT